MTDIQNLWDEVNGRLTAVAVRYPDAEGFIESFRKHVRFALHNPDKAKHHKLLKKGKTWLTEMMWKHPTFRPEFSEIIKRIGEFEQR